MSISNARAMAMRKKQNAKKQNAPKNDPTLSSSASIEEIHDARISRTAIRLVSVGLAAFLIWANFAPVTEIAVGTGEIIPQGLAQNVQHLEGGLVSEILVRDGQYVQRGQPIMRLDDLSARAELAKATTRAEAIRLEIARRSQSAKAPARIFDGALQLRGITNSQFAAGQAEEEFNQAKLKVAQAEVESRRADLTSLSLREEKAIEELRIIERQLVAYEKALKSGAVSRRERDNIARDKIQLESALASVRGQRAAGAAALAQAEASVLELRAGFRQTAEAAIADLEIEAANAQELVTQLRDRLARTTIVAPESGRLLSLVATNPGQVIAPGEQIAQIIPDGQTAIAEVEIPADQIGFISVGMDANVKVLTFDYTRFGSVPAKVSGISASSLKRDPNSDPYFMVQLELERARMSGGSEAREILPGMSVAADVKLGEKTVMNFLLKPLRSLSDRAMTQQ